MINKKKIEQAYQLSLAAVPSARPSKIKNVFSLGYSLSHKYFNNILFGMLLPQYACISNYTIDLLLYFSDSVDGMH